MASLKLIIRFLLISAILGGAAAASANTINLLTDIRVAVFYERTDEIDWPLVYYFTQENGCRVDLVTVNFGPMFKHLLRPSDPDNLTSSRFIVDDTTASKFDSVVSMAFGVEYPDIVVFSGKSEDPTMAAFERYLMSLDADSAGVFYVRKYYRRLGGSDSGDVYLKSKRYWESRYDAIARMAEAVALGTPLRNAGDIYSIYKLVKDNTTAYREKHSFLSGIDRFKFDLIISRNIASSVQRSALGINRKNYVTYLNDALKNQGRERIELLLQAMQEARKIRQTYYYQMGRVDTTQTVAKYIEKTLVSITEAIFYEARVDYKGHIRIIETPEGKKLKFRAEVNNNGYVSVKAGCLDFRPVWQSATVTIDSGWADILPNNSLIREYTVDIPAKELADISEQSLQFIGHVLYAGKDIEFKYSSQAVVQTGFSVELVPDFLIIQPFPELQLDKLVEPAYLKAVLSKPVDYSGEVNIEVIAPEGVHVGAYSKKIPLHGGETAVEIKIPLAVTQSLGDRRQRVIINVGGKSGQLATNMAYVGQCPYEIPGDLNIAVLADHGGVLEDILMQSDAAYRILSDRYITAGEFDYYDIILIGAGTIDDLRAKNILKDKLKKYVEYGGTVLIFGRTGQMGGNLLPISVVQGEETVSAGDLRAKTGSHPMFVKKYKINIPDLLKRATENYKPRPAIVFPGERVIEAGDGTTVLSETKLGEGTVIYCGLPLPEMIRNLDTEAIRLFTNLIIYSGN